MYTKRNRFLLLAAFLLAALGVQAQNPCNFTVDIAPPAAISCQNPSVLLQATITPPSGEYFTIWDGPGGGIPNELEITVTTPGTYYFSVFDSLTQCWTGDTVTVVQDGVTPVVTIVPAPVDCDGTRTLIAEVAPSGGGLSYAWSTGTTTSSITTTPGVPGTANVYCVTITNSDGCSAAACFTVVGNPPFTADIFYFDSGFCNDSLGMWVTPQGGMPPFAYLWSNGVTSPWQPDPVSGTYVVTVTDTRGCTAVTSIVIENESDECANIEGYVLADWNTNCTKEVSDDGLAHIVIRITDASGDERFSYTTTDGFYRVRLFPGTYTIEVVAPNNLWSPCQASYTVTVGPNDTEVRDFLLQPEAICPAMTVDLSAAFLRRCFPSTYSVFYCNQGTVAATDAFIEIQFDPFLSVTNAGIPYTDLGNNLYRFDLGTVPFSTCGSFYVTVLVSCNATLGQTHCSEAVIYPTGTCEPANPLWSGASMQIEADCGTDTLDFAIRNVGTGDMSVPLEYVVIEDAVMLMQAPPPTILLGPGQAHHIKVPANGATWRVEVAQEPFHPGLSMPSQAVEGCANGGQFSVGFVNQFPLNDNDPWVDVDCRDNIGAYDPNDKQGFPIGYGAARYIEPGTDIEYLIRFQNTGTDTAFTVVVRDTLSAWLDPATVRPGASSHPYSFEFYGGNNIKFTFENILLPDSSTNLDASQGFVKFRISQKADVPLQTDILNSAAIFFDFNEPIITNTTVHRVGREFVTVSAWLPFRSGLGLRVLPNPVAQSALLELSGIEGLQDWQVELRDATGRSVRTATASGTQWRFERGDLPAGLYLLQVRTGGQLLGTGKVVLK